MSDQRNSTIDHVTSPDLADCKTLLEQNNLTSFKRDGFVVARGLCQEPIRSEMLQVIEDSLDPALAPVEYEADVHYPGSPASRNAPGGNTPRRLLNAFARDVIFRRWATCETVADQVRSLLQAQHIQVSQNHHNCIMIQYPGYGSATGWRQDIWYRSFDRP